VGEKETTAAGGDEAARRLSVSGSPGGSPSGGIISAAVSSVGQVAPDGGDDLKNASGPLYAEPVNAGNMPAL